MEVTRPQIPESELQAPIGSDMPEKKPLPLLPEREWLVARIVEVKYQVAMFNNQPQYITDMEDNPVLDDDGNKIYRKEFEIVFAFVDYTLSNGEPRKQWLRLGASMGARANLPVFLFNVLGVNSESLTPNEVIKALSGKRVKLQIANKFNEDKSKIYQKVIFDAVRSLDAPNPTVANPIKAQDLDDVDDSMAANMEDEPAPWGIDGQH